MIELNISQIHSDILFYLKPCFNNKSVVDKNILNICKYIESIFEDKKEYGVCELCAAHFKKWLEKYEEASRIRAERNAQQTREALEVYNNVMNNASTPGLGFSILTNNVADAALYTVMNARETQRQYMDQVTLANKMLLQSLPKGNNKNGLDSYEIGELLSILEITISDIISLYNSLEVYEQNNNETMFKCLKQHQNEDWNGIHVAKILLSFYSKNKKYKYLKYYDASKESLQVLEAFGFLNQLPTLELGYNSSYDIKPVYMSSGKYEQMIVDQDKVNDAGLSVQNIDDKAVEEIYIQAQEKLEKKEYYKAATLFGSIPDYKDARVQSYEIWLNRLLTHPLVKCASKRHFSHRYLSSDGNYVDGSGKVFYNNAIEERVTFDGKLLGHPDDFSEMNECAKKDYHITKVLGNEMGLLDDGRILSYTPYATRKDWTFDLQSLLGNRNVRQVYREWSDRACVVTENGEVKLYGKYVTEGLDCSSWIDIVKIVGAYNFIAGLSSTGQVYVTCKRDPLIKNQPFMKANEWSSVIKIGCLSDGLYAIKSDGSVLYADYYKEKSYSK